MSVQATLESIEAGKLKPIYLFHGEEDYFIDQLTNAVIEKALQPHERDFNLTVLYGRDADPIQVIDAAKRFPMMAQYQVVVLKEGQQMKQMASRFEALIDLNVPTTILVLNHKNSKADGRSKLMKHLKKSGAAVEAKKLSENHMPNWINAYLKNEGFETKDNVEQLLATYLGTNLTKVVNELEKLVINVEKGTPIDSEIVSKNIGIHTEFNLFALQDAIVNGDAGKAYKIGDYFAKNNKKNPTPLVLATLFSYFNKLYTFHSVKNKDAKTQQEATKTYNDFFLRKLKSAAMRFKPEKLEHIIQLISEYDLKSKGVGQSGKNDDAFYKELIFKILN